MLAFMPLCAAIAAGNCAVIKPSELSPHSAALIAELVPKYLDKSCYKVVTGIPVLISKTVFNRDFMLFKSIFIGKYC